MRAILSIDGGGIRGIIPALVLAKLEQYLCKRTAFVFDLIAGTSTGGILALALSKPNDRNSPQYSAAELVNLYEEHGATIFKRPAWRKFLPASALFEQKYDAQGLESVLEHYFGDCRLSSAYPDVLITSYEIERRFPFFFRSKMSRILPGYDFPMKVAARATSAAPTFFEPVKIPAEGPAGYYALVDGGLYANNPSLCALIEGRSQWPGEPTLLVSLGTGSLTRPISYDDSRHWGVARWAKPVLDIAFDGVSSTVDYQVKRVLVNEYDQRQVYFRFQPVLDPGLTQMDDASPRNIRRLKLLAESMIREREEELQVLAAMLYK